MNTWTKAGDQWAVRCDQQQAPGDRVVVTTKAGKTKQVTLGERLNLLGFVYTVAEEARPAAQTVGDLSGVLALFDKAAKHLKYPAIVLAIAESAARGFTIRLSIAGERARVPGSITVCDGERGDDGRDWFGRILRDGTYEPARAANGRTEAITKRLREFAAEPALIAKDSARLTGRCCFCNTRIGGDGDPSTWTEESKESVRRGYGRTCASHYGVAWGKAEGVSQELADYARDQIIGGRK